MRSFLIPEHQAFLRFLDRQGEGIPLVYLHGLGCASTSDFQAIASHPALSKHRHLLIDLLGSGSSDQPETFGYALEDHATCLLELLDHLGLAPVILFGHSMGGSIAITAASRQPDRISGLILSEPNLDPGGGVFSRSIAAEPEARYLAAGHARQIASARQSGNEAWAASMARSLPAAIHREACSLVRGTDPSWRAQLAAARMPRTVLFGEHSLPDPDFDELPRLGIRVALVPRSGHSMMWDNPEGVAEEIARSRS